MGINGILNLQIAQINLHVYIFYFCRQNDPEILKKFFISIGQIQVSAGAFHVHTWHSRYVVHAFMESSLSKPINVTGAICRLRK